jgi:hypothetical protein
MQLVFESPTYRIEHDPARRIVVLHRTRVSLSREQLDKDLADVIAVLRPLRGQRLLVDVRLAPGNNDPVFEQKIHLFRRELAALFPILGTLVATATGRLQIARMNKERGDRSNSVFTDEEDAIGFLMAHSLP